MAGNLLTAIRTGWNAFLSPDDVPRNPFGYADYGTATSFRPDRFRGRQVTNERSIVTSIYTRIGVDAAGLDIRHVRLDEEERYQDDISSGLSRCIRVEANIDQAGSMFRQDIVMSLLNEGVIAVVPVDTTIDPMSSGSYDVKTMRVGRIVQWFPRHVTVNLYNDRKGTREDVTLAKDFVAIIENPLYAVMNEPNSTLQRLVRKLSLIDGVDEQTASGKLDLIIQLPYVVKSEARRQQAQQRRDDLEVQLTSGKYGVAYTDGTEKVIQLNRPVENTLMAQITYLTQMLYGQLGITEEIMNGTADEKTMLNYQNRTIKPILRAITEEFRRKFLTKTAQSQGQSILFFRDPFDLMPLSDVADVADKFSRNEVLTSNEIRQGIGIRPSKEPKADQLINSNMPASDTGVSVPGSDPSAETGDAVDTSGATDTSAADGIDQVAQTAMSGYGDLNSQLDELMKELDDGNSSGSQ